MTHETVKIGIIGAGLWGTNQRGLPPTMMAGFDGRIPDEDMWSIVNYLRSLAPQKPAR